VSAEAYPWYQCVSGDDLEQGDILDGCPVFLPPPDLAVDLSAQANFRWEKRDVIVMSQSCDLVKGQKNIAEVLVCLVWNLSSYTTGHLSNPKGKEEARRGYLPSIHMLAECTLEGLKREVRIVDFRQIHSLPVPFCRELALRTGNRIRLLPPYREHLAQAFARFFMRVGLPVDIPPFR
jgi:hypothetical protein